MGKHHLPAMIAQPPRAAPALKLVRFWENGWQRCVSNTLVAQWRWTVGDTRASFDLWAEHPLANIPFEEFSRLRITTNEDVPVVWHIDKIMDCQESRDCRRRVYIVDGWSEIQRLLPSDEWLLNKDWTDVPGYCQPVFGPGVHQPPDDSSSEPHSDPDGEDPRWAGLAGGAW